MKSQPKYDIIDVEYPIDCIFESQKYIIACGYLYKDTCRSGMVYFFDKKTLKILDSVKTTGTLQGCSNKNRIYLANADNISLFDENSLIKTYKTEVLNTYISIEKNVLASDVSGNIHIFDEDLNHIETFRGSEDPIWVVKQHKHRVYFGDEAGFSYCYDCIDREIIKIGKRRDGIIDILIDNSEIMFSSYDGNVEIYDLESLTLIKKIEDLGSLWKMIKCNDKIISSAIYDGLKVFDCGFREIKQIKTETICYAVYFENGNVIWSPFYSNMILKGVFSEILTEENI